MATESTTIRISRDTWDDLHAKKSPGESFDDVLQELLDETEICRSQNEK